MSRLDHWHPVLPSSSLARARAVAVRLAGRDIALFRRADGAIGAVDDRCAHRRMKLSLGRVSRERLVCPYHGWSYGADGHAESPVNPNLDACVESYDTCEREGAIWLRRRGAVSSSPDLSHASGSFAGVVFNRVKAPLELVIDNFCEVEHTIATHTDFGFDPARAAEATVEIETTDNAVTVRNTGPAKRLPLATQIGVAMRPGDLFHSDFSFRFDPPRSSVVHRWTDPFSGAERRLSYHIVHFFVPEDAAHTMIVSFPRVRLHSVLLRALRRQIGWLVRRKLGRTVEEDAFLVENLADASTSLEGMRLGRFDAVLALTRERLRRIYDD